MAVPYMLNDNSSISETLTKAICQLNNITLPKLKIKYIKEDDSYIYYEASPKDKNPKYIGTFTFKVAKINKGSVGVNLYPNFNRNEGSYFIKYEINDLIGDEDYRNGKLDGVEVSPIVAHGIPTSTKDTIDIKDAMLLFEVGFLTPFFEYNIGGYYEYLMGRHAFEALSIDVKLRGKRVIPYVSCFELDTKDYVINENGSLWQSDESLTLSGIPLYKEYGLIQILKAYCTRFFPGDEVLDSDNFYYNGIIIGGVEIEKGKFSAIDIFFPFDPGTFLPLIGVITFFGYGNDPDISSSILDYQAGYCNDGTYDISKVYGKWVTRAYAPPLYNAISKLFGDYYNGNSSPMGGISSPDQVNGRYGQVYDAIPTTNSIYHPNRGNSWLADLPHSEVYDSYYQLVPVFFYFRLKWHFDEPIALRLSKTLNVDVNNIREHIKNKYKVLLLSEQAGLEVELLEDTPNLKKFKIIAKKGLAVAIHGYNDYIIVEVN